MLRDEHGELLAEYASKRNGAEQRSQEMESRLDEARTTMTEMERKMEMVSASDAKRSQTDLLYQMETKRQDAIKSRDAARSELDDLLIVFGDLEDKLAKYQVSEFVRQMW